MSRGRGAALALLLAGGLAALPARADDAPQGEAKAAAASGWGDDTQALRAFGLVADGKMIGAREAAERLLRERPDSFEAEFVLGYALHVAEGDLPRSYHHLALARARFEARYGKKPGAQAPWRWHLAILEELASVAREMDRWEEVLALLDAHDAAYDPDDVVSRGWPLLRLHRFDEARRVAARALASKDPVEVQMAQTTLCGVESELGRRQASYAACSLPLRGAALDQPHIYTNAASAALEVLKMDEAERLMLEGTRHFSEGNAANPWLDLMQLYLGQGRAAEATSAVREALVWRRAQPPYMDEQTGAETEFGSALFLLVAGRGPEAARISGRILDRPDRTGFTSADSAQAEAANALLHRAALNLAAERRREEASWLSGLARVRAWSDALQLSVRAWAAGRQAGRRLSDEGMLVATLRPYLPGGVAVPPWMVGDLGQVLGPGVLAAALARARGAEDLHGADGYFDALAADAASGRGDWTGALGAARSALGELPKPEVLLQARAAAVGAEAAWELGDTAGAVRLFGVALQSDPGAIRRLGLALPAVVGGAGGAAAEELVAFLRRSPRFTAAHGGFQVSVAEMGNGLEACLLGPEGESVSCTRASARAGEGPAALAARTAALFHEQVFAPRVDLTQGDLQSLDGSTTVARERSARKIQGVIDALGGGSAPARP